MTWYVPNGNKSERCRAKDPAHCWYHVGKDGKVLQHYPTPEACRKAIEDEAKRRNTGNKRSLSKAGKVTSGMSREDMLKAIMEENGLDEQNESKRKTAKAKSRKRTQKQETEARKPEEEAAKKVEDKKTEEKSAKKVEDKKTEEPAKAEVRKPKAKPARKVTKRKPVRKPDNRSQDMLDIRKPEITGNALTDQDWDIDLKEYEKAKEAHNASASREYRRDAEEDLYDLQQVKDEARRKGYDSLVKNVIPETDKIGNRATALKNRIDQERKSGKDSKIKSLVGKTIVFADDVTTPAGKRAVKMYSTGMGGHYQMHTPVKILSIENDKRKRGFYRVRYEIQNGDFLESDEWETTFPKNSLDPKSINDKLYSNCQNALDLVNQNKSLEIDMNDPGHHIIRYDKAADLMHVKPEKIYPSDFAIEFDEQKCKDVINEKSGPIDDKYRQTLATVVGDTTLADMSYVSKEDRHSMFDSLKQANPSLEGFNVFAANKDHTRYAVEVENRELVPYNEEVGDNPNLFPFAVVNAKGQYVDTPVTEEDNLTRNMRYMVYDKRAQWER